MRFLRRFLDSLEPHFINEGKLKNYYAIYEMIDTFLYTPDTVTFNGPHIRDSIDLKRSMIFVVIAMIPAILFGIFNVGYQEDSTRTVVENFFVGLYVVAPIIIVSYFMSCNYSQIKMGQTSLRFAPSKT